MSELHPVRTTVDDNDDLSCPTGRVDLVSPGTAGRTIVVPIGLGEPPSVPVMAVSTLTTEIDVLRASLPVLLTIEEAAQVLRIGRSLAYDLAHRYEATGGQEGLPVLRGGR